MSPKDPLTRITHLYHFTDRRNLEFIRKHNGLFPLEALRKMGITIPAPGGNEWSQDVDQMIGMDHYVHLCFRNSHPMEFRARQDGRIQDSIFLQIHPDVLQFNGVLFVPDVANKSGVQTFSIEDARGMIDFDVLYTQTNWRNPEIQQRLQQAEKCEILVPQHIPLAMIRNIPHG